LKDLRELFNQVVEARLETIAEEDRNRVRADSKSRLSDTITYVLHTCDRLAASRINNETVSAKIANLTERRTYEDGCRYFGVRVPKGGLCNYAEYRKVFRAKVRPTHPDQNPGREDEVRPLYEEIVMWSSVVEDYHNKYDSNRNSVQRNYEETVNAT